jgi:hypothetical protein
MQFAEVPPTQKVLVEVALPRTALAAGSMLEAAGVLNSSTRPFSTSAI